MTIFGIFNELLATQNVDVARFARNVECDFFGGFQTLWCAVYVMTVILLCDISHHFSGEKCVAL